MVLIPGWPKAEERISFQTGPTSAWPPAYWVDVTSRTMNQNDSARGRQYELDQVQTGEYHCVWSNTDAALTPGNVSPPYYPNVVPYRAFQRRSQSPVTANILSVDQATSGSTQAAGGHVDALVPVWFSYNVYWTIAAESDAYVGPNVFQQVLSSAPSAGAVLADMDGWTVRPGAAHSAQCVMRATAGGTTPQVRLMLTWRDVNGVTISSVAGTTVTLTANSRTWQQLTVSGTPPANVAGATLQIQMVNSVAVTLEASGFQVEYAAAPSTWGQPGVWSNRFTGWIERWPETYNMAGTFAEIEPVIVDSFGQLSQAKLKPCFYLDILALAPDFFYPLDDPSGSLTFADLAGKRNPVPAVTSPYGAGSLTAGQGIQSTTAGGGFLGGPGPVVTFGNTVSSSTMGAATYVDFTRVGVVGPPAGSGWTRMVAFRVPTVPVGTDTALWSWNNATFSAPFGGSIGLFIDNTTGASPGALSLRYGTSSVAIVILNNNVCDGNWHLAVITVDSTGIIFDCQVDGVEGHVTLSSSLNQSNVQSDSLGAALYAGNNYVENAFAGDVACVAQWPYVLTSTQMTNLYTSWRNAWSGESSGSRYARILGYAGYAGATAIETGATTNMGPASDIPGNDVVTCLQNVVTTENGNHYVRGDGTIVFEARTDRYNRQTPTFVFGENTANGEYPYEDCAFDFDLTRVANDIQVTQFESNQVFYGEDATSQAANGLRTLQRTVNAGSTSECQDAATYLLSRYKAPQRRLRSLTLHPSAMASPNLWAVVQALELSTRIRVMRRPPGAPAIQWDGFVEAIKRAETPGDVVVELQASPADLSLYWVQAALHTTLTTQATAGVNTATLAALPDSASNPFSASVPSGLVLTFEPGTARAESIAVQSVSATSPGYTSCTVTLAANLAFTHASGTVACEQLPAGITDPTTWDALALLGTTTTLTY